MSNRSLLHIDLFVKNPENLHLLSRMIQKKQEILTLRSRNQQMFDICGWKKRKILKQLIDCQNTLLLIFFKSTNI